jgi:hypothetical protein
VERRAAASALLAALLAAPDSTLPYDFPNLFLVRPAAS